MTLTKADDYPIHQTPDPIAFSGVDRNFYDRYFFNGYTRDGHTFFGAALGVYPQLGIMDAAFAIRIGDRQYNVRASRHLVGDRTDTAVGPIRVEVVEPLRQLRILVDDREHGVSADLLFEGRHAPIEEPRHTRRTGTRLFMDVTRMTQLGSYSGWARAGGQDLRIAPGEMLGTRDRSWGIRSVGVRDPQPAVPAAIAQFHWYWVPAQFADRVMHFYINEDETGTSWNLGMIVVRDGEAPEALENARLEPVFAPGTRWPQTAVISARDADGGVYRVEMEAARRFYLSGLGYSHPEWGHGVNHGPLAVGFDEIATDEITRYEQPYIHAQAFAAMRMTTPGGHVLPGIGALESFGIGPHAPLGFTGMFDAP